MAAACALLTAHTLAGCAGDGESGDGEGLGIVGNSKLTPSPGAISTDPEATAKPNGPKLAAVKMAVLIRERPDPRSKQIGYLRVGDVVTRAKKPAAFDSCQGGYYNVLPKGYVCVGARAVIDMSHPLVKANIRPASRSKPLPYSYAFVRGIAPRYYRLPTEREQYKTEMSLKRHIRSFKRLKHKWNGYKLGANDVPIDPLGIVLGDPPASPPELNSSEKFGGLGDDAIPWFFTGGRKIPNVSNFKVPDYAVFTNRIKRHAGVALVDAFQGDQRHFALTTDLRLIPTSKLKPGRGSVFHGVELSKDWELPMGFVRRKRAYKYKRGRGGYKRIKRRYAYGSPIQLTGEVRKSGKKRMLETEDGNWVRTRDLAVVAKLGRLPRFAKKGGKWIDVSIQRQSLTLYEGTKAVYATMVSTGKDGLGNPRKTHSTPRGTFRIRDKHVTHTMDSQVVGSEFELNDVPWVQYFKAGYALHAAYWHTEYGRARSHGCINLAPIDAYRIFKWTDPPLPEKWHGVSASETTGEGTRVHVHP